MRGLRPRALAAAALLVAALGATGGCGGSSSHTSTARAQALARARTMRLGAHIFAARCASCHALLGQPNTDFHSDAPPLDLDQVRLTRAYATAIVERGRVGMGGFGSGELGPGGMRAIVDYLLAVGGREVGVPAHVPVSVLARGRAVYEERCQRCHAMEGRKPTRPNPIWPAPGFEEVRPSVQYVEQKVREGQREAMPAFPDMPGADVHALALYVNATALRRR